MAFRQAVFVALALAGAPAPLAAQSQKLTPDSLVALESWVRAVNAHVPGRPDPAIRWVTAMPFSARFELNRAYPLFMRVVRDNFVAGGGDLEEQVTRIGQSVQQKPGYAAFLKRAAVFHGDAVVFAERFPPPRAGEPAGSAVNSRGRPLPLLTNDVITLTRDGEVVGYSRADWNLPFARSLLDALLDQGAPAGSERRSVHRDDVEFAANWYHAIAAQLFANGMYADADKHLQQSARILPDDVRLLFDRGTYAETLGLPIYQTVRDPKVPSEEKTNAEAERLYRRALEIDPSYVEARVRLARLLDRRGQFDEAEQEIGRALEAHPSGIAAFYAFLVGGRIAASRGRYEESLQRYRAASALNPHAQSAQLGVSHASLMLADVPQALTALEALNRGAPPEDADPWFDYRLGAGRDAKELLAALWQRAAQ